MVKQAYILIVTLILILCGCKDGNQSIKNKEPNSVIKKIELNIEGDNIWVRDIPKRGNVVMKLNQGDRCVIIDTSELDTIKGAIDYWYKIKYNDTIGWVFGSQTNIKTESSKKNQLYLEQNHKKLSCDNIDYQFINDNENRYLLSLVIYSGDNHIDTISFKGKKIHAQKKEWVQNFIKQDYNFDSIYIVDNKRIDFIYRCLKYAKSKFTNSDITFFYPDTGKNIIPTTKKNFGKILPIEYINSSILPLRIEEELTKTTTLALYTIEPFDIKDLKRLISLSKELSKSWPSKIVILFPDYNEVRNSSEVRIAKSAFEEETFTDQISVESYNDNFKSLQV